MDEMFKGKIKHTIQKIKDEINGVDNVGWHVADGYLAMIETDAMFAGMDVLVDFISKEKANIRGNLSDVSVDDFTKTISEIEKMI